jgi:hypothetical protein
MQDENGKILKLYTRSIWFEIATCSCVAGTQRDLFCARSTAGTILATVVQVQS